METNFRKLLDQMMAPYDEMLQSLIGDHADFSKVDYLEKHAGPNLVPAGQGGQFRYICRV